MQFVVEQPSQLQPRPSAIATHWFDRKKSMYHVGEPRSFMILTGGISCTPKITKCIKEIPDCPWYTLELDKPKRERRKAEYTWRKFKSERDHKAFKGCRNRFRNKCETKKLEYYKNKVDNCEGDQKKLFKVLESLTSRKNDTPYLEHSSVDELAKKFGQFFMEKNDKVRNGIKEILQNENLITDENNTRRLCMVKIQNGGLSWMLYYTALLHKTSKERNAHECDDPLGPSVEKEHQVTWAGFHPLCYKNNTSNKY